MSAYGYGMRYGHRYPSSAARRKHRRWARQDMRAMLRDEDTGFMPDYLWNEYRRLRRRARYG